ncbi:MULTISPECIES: DivIVA domain-containing protein [unclassified Spirosoma]|uniref:DivIVA domain-containing protein n=1 Tax=unclassified Spirosoma TaxID=2621999 RepID=UPI00095ECFFE|nr:MULTISPECIES: DivIVA domain-containing protein [unclassified Spirosoma]MBN8824595.1 DivIVA domain-containing protein [Spirosoma sp.]OJW70954.1 MAG: cell division protein DivIVA [Spirosoma sp. 48-14]
MKITPIEIRQHTFEKGLRGYRPEDVDAFLVSLSQEWERVTGEYKMLKMQLELAEKELGKLKEIEMTLFRTLKTAEENSANITEQANKAGEKYIAEAKQKADEIIADARKRSALMVQDAENQARYLKDNILNDLKSLEHDFKALEGYKENLASQIRLLASNAVDSVDRFEKKFSKQNLKGKIDEVSNQIKEETKLADGKAATEASDDVKTEPISHADATELPALVEREASIPEAIPDDKDTLEKLDDAIQETQSEHAHTAVPESVLEEASTPEPEASEEAPVKKGGSFFDQI